MDSVGRNAPRAAPPAPAWPGRHRLARDEAGLYNIAAARATAALGASPRESIMTDAETKTCPRCGRPFTCQAEQVERCECASVDLAPSTLRYLHAHYADCLCVACLRTLNDTIEGLGSPTATT